LRLFSFGGYGLALAVFGAIECPPSKAIPYNQGATPCWKSVHRISEDQGYQSDIKDISRISIGYQGYQPDIKDVSQISRISAGYQGCQPDIKDISRISRISARYQGYQPDIKDISEISRPFVHRMS